MTAPLFLPWPLPRFLDSFLGLGRPPADGAPTTALVLVPKAVSTQAPPQEGF